MLSKEWIYEDDLPDDYPYDLMFPLSKVDAVRMFPSLEFVRDLALVGLSVQEGLKDAREAFEDFVTPNGYSVETDPDGEYACPEVRLQKYAFMAGARHNAAFALKQKGEVVWEGEGWISKRDDDFVIQASYEEDMTKWQTLYYQDNEDKPDFHVTISLPQQEQE